VTATSRPGSGDDADRSADDDLAAPPGHVEHGSEEEIDEAGDESFPASDAPQWWSGEPDDET
jgi:hypothetical protein